VTAEDRPGKTGRTWASVRKEPWPWKRQAAAEEDGLRIRQPEADGIRRRPEGVPNLLNKIVAPGKRPAEFSASE